MTALAERQDNTLRLDRADSTEPKLPKDSSEATDRNEPIDRMEPDDPMDKIDPEDPIDRIDPVEPIDKIDPDEPRLMIEPDEPRLRALSMDFMELLSQPCAAYLAAARRARPSTKMSISISNRSSGSEKANSLASSVMFGNWSAGSEAM